jgi:hypothetical protein
MSLNVNIPHIYGFCTGVDKLGRLHECIIHGARSRAGKILTFHVLMTSGASYSLLPIHKLRWKEVETPLEPEQLQPWDCLGDDMEVIKFDLFEFKRVYVIPLNIWGGYLFTFDWKNNVFSDYPPESKNAHFIKLDNGQFGCYPNNYLLFEDKSFTGKVDTENIPRLARQEPSDYVSVEQKVK